MAFFMTKKQKQLMRERRRKKRLAGGNNSPAAAAQGAYSAPPTSAAAKNKFTSSSSGKKRPRSEAKKESEDSNSILSSPTAEAAATTTTTTKPIGNFIIVPTALSSKEAKKFRKDARRQARAEGRDENALQFITQEEHEKQQHQTKHKKRKVEFPRIKQLLQEEKLAKEKQAHVDALKKAEDKLPDEYKANYIALDCEMVGIGSDGKKSALARVSLTNWHGDTVLDTFVQVPTRVTDFRTWVSGVKPKHIQETQAMEVAKCREIVASLLKNKIVVGHALKNDFNALMISHPKQDIRDTAKYRRFQRYGGNKWRPRKLRDLVKENLDLVIQEEGKSHDSVDDAKAAMELFKLARVEWEKELVQKLKKKK